MTCFIQSVFDFRVRGEINFYRPSGTDLISNNRQSGTDLISNNRRSGTDLISNNRRSGTDQVNTNGQYSPVHTVQRQPW